jgi:hypothetical protein
MGNVSNAANCALNASMNRWNMTDSYGQNQNGTFTVVNGTWNVTVNVSNVVRPWDTTSRSYYFMAAASN